MQKSYWLIEGYTSPVETNEKHIFLSYMDEHGVARYRSTEGKVRDSGAKGIYVADYLGNLYMTPRCKFVPHHSDFLKGGSVLCAGIYKLNQQGQVVYFDNNSGHYHPRPESLYHMVRIVKESGYKGRIVYKNCYMSGIELINSIFLKKNCSDKNKRYGRRTKDVSNAGPTLAD